MGHATLTLCRIELRPYGVETLFPDGTRSANWIPYADRSAFEQVARDCGFDDPLAYVREHDISHAFLAERMFGMVSPTLYSAAHGERRHSILDRRQFLFEERMVWHWQRYARGIGARVEDEWQAWLEGYRELLDGLGIG